MLREELVMRLLGLSIGLCLLGIAHPVQAKPAFPYAAYVTVENAYVRSGPGNNYYPTDKLSTGTRVEVYRHDPGGWYAIRPPQNSFSWVSSRNVEPTENGLGRVTDPRVAARVGSRFSNVRDVIQVRLDKGETVQILGERNVGGQTWYKIAPPAGEFRWISARSLDHRPARTRLEGTQAAEQQDPGRSESPVGTAVRPDARSTTRQGGAVGRPATEPRDDHRIDLASTGARPTPPLEAVLPTATDGIISDLGRINHALSVMVAEEPNVWEFSEVERQTQAIARRARTDAERGAANRLLYKIARLKDIKARHDRLMTSSQVVQADPRDRDRDTAARAHAGDAPRQWPAASLAVVPQQAGPVSLTVPLPGPVPTPIATRDVPASSDRVRAREDPQNPSAVVTRRTAPPRDGQFAAASPAPFDSVGTLRPVVSHRRAAPRYALVDPHGTVVSFVTAAPGIDLKPYLGRRVGVAGKRSYIPEFRRTHVTARHVMALGDTVIR